MNTTRTIRFNPPVRTVVRATRVTEPARRFNGTVFVAVVCAVAVAIAWAF